MKVTDELFDSLAAAANKDAYKRDTFEFPRLRKALEAALADVPEQVPGPFVLTPEEQSVYNADLVWTGIPRIEVLRGALKRALATLGAPAEPLSETQYNALEIARQRYKGDRDEAYATAIVEVLARFPKPAPVQRTPEELAAHIRSNLKNRVCFDTALEALNELVRRAK